MCLLVARHPQPRHEQALGRLSPAVLRAPPGTPKPAAVQSSAEGRRRGQAPAARAAWREGLRPAARAPPGAGVRALETRLAGLSCLPSRVDRPPLLTHLAGGPGQGRFLSAAERPPVRGE